MQKENVLLGAVGAVDSKIPSFIFEFYVKTLKGVSVRYRTPSGLPVIQFLAGARGENPDQDKKILGLMDYFISQGALVDEPSQDRLGLTTLQMALLSRDFELTQFLVERGADVNGLAAGERYRGMTPLRFALEAKKVKSDTDLEKILEYLHQKGAHQ